MKYILLLLACLTAHAQPFTFNDPAMKRFFWTAGTVLPITGANVETNGWVLDLYLSATGAPAANTYTNGSNGGFQFPWSTNNTATSSLPLSITMSTPGFDNTGASNLTTRTIYATRPLRLPYPNYTNVDATLLNGTNLVVRLALSDYVRTSDTNLSGSLSAAFYSNNVAYSISVTNGSVMAPATHKVIGNWSWPDFCTIPSNTFTLRCVVFEQHAQNGLPVACVKFTARDAHLHTNTVTVTAPIVQTNMNDAVYICEYVGNMDASTFQDGDPVICDFAAYPWVGDTTSLMNTADGKMSIGGPFYHSLTWRLNTNGAFAKSWAVVGLGGNDSTGFCVQTNPFTGAQPAAFATIGAATSALKGTNNITSGGANNTCGGGTVYLLPGSYSYTSVPDDVMSSWVTFASHPTNAVKAALTNGPGSNRRGSLVCMTNLALAFPGSINFPFFGHSNYWVAGCFLNSACATVLDQGGMFLTGNTVSNWAQYFTAAEAPQEPVRLLRGNSVYTKITAWDINAVLGNLYSDSTSVNVALLNATKGNSKYTPDYSLCCFNKFLNTSSSAGSTFGFWQQSDCLTNGAAIVQNLFEQTGTVGPTFIVHGDGSSGATTNCMVWNNTVAGFWNNLWYNDTGSSPVYSVYCTERGNVWEAHHTKTDTFTGTPNASRIGNWPAMWGVGFNGNFDQQKTNVTSSGGFTLEFAGLNSYQPPFTPASATYWNSQQGGTNFVKFFLNGASDGGTTGAGGGNYHLRTTSPGASAQGFSVGWYGLPVDMEGNSRSASDPPGVYATTQ